MKVIRMSILLSFIGLLLLATAGSSDAHNITHILAKYPEFSTFNHYLTTTHLAAEINRRRTITVCAVDNSAMSELLSGQYSLYTIKNILRLHIFADYFGSKKLHHITKGSTTTSSLFQATGDASGTFGYVNITVMKGGKVGFTPVVVTDTRPDGQPMATFVKSVEELPYNISVIQISHILSSPDAEAPTASPTDVNITTLMADQGCKSFSDLIMAQPGVGDTFAQSVEGGLTIFCPSDSAVKSFIPSYKNLTAAGKTSLLLYHGVPVYNSLVMLRSSKGLMNTLATEGAGKYDFTVENDGEDVKLQTKIVTAMIKETLIDEDPLVVYKIDKVLLPKELFKELPAKLKSHGGADAPGPGGDGDGVPADENSGNGGGRIVGGGGIMALSLILGVLLSVCII
ncbi:hypothetical protein ACP275_08G123900 [Erythranthe tilingii]